MKILRMAGMLAVSILIAEFPWKTGSICAEETHPDLGQTQREITSMLMKEGTLADLAKKTCVSKAKTAQEAMSKLEVLMRAGMNKEAFGALQELKILCPELESYQIQLIYYAACDQYQMWDIARAALEIFADKVSNAALSNRLLPHLLNTGWDIEKIDKWLAEKPMGQDNFWLKERLQFAAKHGRAEILVRNLAEDAKINPRDIENIITFLDSLFYVTPESREKEIGNLEWLMETVKPERAIQASDIASRLKRLCNWTAAAAFYQLAISIPLTSDEISHLRNMSQVAVTPEFLKARFAIQVREELAECLLKLNQKEEAQKWMVEAVNIRKENNLQGNMFLAGSVQLASGQRVVEERIKIEEVKSETDPAYWLDRSEYYRGRKEAEKEEEALKKGLVLTVPKPEQKGPGDMRSRFLTDYTRFLIRENRRQEAVSLLLNELEQAPPDSASSTSAAYRLAFDFEKQVSGDSEVLWAWLSKRPKWDYTEERLLRKMLENAKKEDTEKLFSRAEKLTREKDPSRAYTLGWLMNRLGYAKRSIPLFQEAVEKADRTTREKAVFALFESYLDINDWQHSEQLFPDAAVYLTSKEGPEWYSKIAVAAMKSGSKTDSLRIWKRVVNISPSETKYLRFLARNGLKNDLLEIYREMQKAMPTSEIPPKVLEILKDE